MTPVSCMFLMSQMVSTLRLAWCGVPALMRYEAGLRGGGALTRDSGLWPLEVSPSALS